MIEWYPYEVPCTSCKNLVVTERDPESRSLVSIQCAACGQSFVPQLQDIVTPPPIISSEEMPEGDARIPPPAAKMRLNALSAGLAVCVTFAKGHYRTKQSIGIVESVAVRMRSDKTGAVGIWHDSRFKTGFIFSRTRFDRVNSTDLKGWIDAER